MTKKKAVNETFGMSGAVHTCGEQHVKCFLLIPGILKNIVCVLCSDVKLENLHLFPGGIMDQLHSHDTVCSR